MKNSDPALTGNFQTKPVGVWSHLRKSRYWKIYISVERVDLGSILSIHHILIKYRTDNLPWGDVYESTSYKYLYQGAPVKFGTDCKRKIGPCQTWHLSNSAHVKFGTCQIRHLHFATSAPMICKLGTWFFFLISMHIEVCVKEHVCTLFTHCLS